jgi:methionyl-tRNA formyltransferase
VRVVYLAKCKRSAARALEWLVSEGAEVAAVVASEPDSLTREEQRVDLAAERHGVPLVSAESLYESPPDAVDLVISFLFWARIREPLLSLGRLGCLNFHPAPLPDMRGLGGYNVAILEGMREWGVSCHFVEPDFDTGPVVETERFAMDPDTATAFSLDLESQERLYRLFTRVLGRALAGEELPRAPQREGRYVNREELEALRWVRPGDDLDRKLRAFWYPPHPGALLDVDGRPLTLVNDELLAEAARAYRDSGQVP